MLEDAWPAGEVRSVMRVEDYDPAEDRAVLAGHLGLLPRSPRVVTLLREPAARAWSHYHAVRFPGERPSFADFLEHPVYRWCGADYQASLLGIPPQPGEARQAAIDAGLPAPPAVVARRDGVAARAQRTLDECALTGTTERADEFVVALGRLLGRRLPPLQQINVRADAAEPPAAEAALVRERSRGDLALHEHAGRLLDAALRALPELPPEPLARPAAAPRHGRAAVRDGLALARASGRALSGRGAKSSASDEVERERGLEAVDQRLHRLGDLRLVGALDLLAAGGLEAVELLHVVLARSSPASR